MTLAAEETVLVCREAATGYVPEGVRSVLSSLVDAC